jgi:myo-inositol-1(or 4)-monophosphatase
MAQRGHGAQRQSPRGGPQACRVSRCTDLARARITTGVPDDPRGGYAAACARLGARAASHGWGGDAYAYGLLADGRLDLVIETGLDAHDFLAPAVVVEAAGGIVTDAAGRPLGLGSDGTVVAAATTELHARALDELRAAGR